MNNFTFNNFGSGNAATGNIPVSNAGMPNVYPSQHRQFVWPMPPQQQYHHQYQPQYQHQHQHPSYFLQYQPQYRYDPRYLEQQYQQYRMQCQQRQQHQCQYHSQQYQQYQYPQYQLPHQSYQPSQYHQQYQRYAEPVQAFNAGTLPHQREAEPEPELFEDLLQQDLFPVQQQPTHQPFVGSTWDAPIEIDNDVEVLTQELTPIPASQERQPTTPQAQETPCVPVNLKKPENSFFSELTSEPDKNGKIKRLSIEAMARRQNVRMAALKSVPEAERAQRIFDEDLARVTKLARRRRAKELGLANPVDDEDEELVDVGAAVEEEPRPASLKRKSAELAEQHSSDTERAPKMIRVESEPEPEQFASPTSSATVPVIFAPETEHMSTEIEEAFLQDEDEDEEKGLQYADLEVVEGMVGDDVQVTTAPPSVGRVVKARRARRKKAAYKTRVTAALEEEGEKKEEGKDEKEESPEAYQARMEKEAYLAVVAAELEAELDEDELIERPRSPSVSSDEDEDDDYIGNRKYRKY